MGLRLERIVVGGTSPKRVRLELTVPFFGVFALLRVTHGFVVIIRFDAGRRHAMGLPPLFWRAPGVPAEHGDKVTGIGETQRVGNAGDAARGVGEQELRVLDL